MIKILVIEHETCTRNFFLKALKSKDFYAIGAENGRVGLQQARKQLPDLIICGTMMPELDGYSVLTALRQEPATAIIPFIFVTAQATQTDLCKAMELGANGYLTKPCSLEELIRAITVQLEKQTILRRCYATQSQLVQEAPCSETATKVATSGSIFPSDAKLSNVFRFIEANYQRSITLDDVAQAVGYSPAYLTNLTRRQTGQTVQRWIIERRMVAARSLLLETDQLVEQIAIEVGYQSVVHFFRQFRQFHGTTPQAWRSSHRS